MRPAAGSAAQSRHACSRTVRCRRRQAAYCLPRRIRKRQGLTDPVCREECCRLSRPPPLGDTRCRPRTRRRAKARPHAVRAGVWALSFTYPAPCTAWPENMTAPCTAGHDSPAVVQFNEFHVGYQPPPPSPPSRVARRVPAGRQAVAVLSASSCLPTRLLATRPPPARTPAPR